jgi:hypothetical protein
LLGHITEEAETEVAADFFAVAAAAAKAAASAVKGAAAAGAGVAAAGAAATAGTAAAAVAAGAGAAAAAAAVLVKQESVGESVRAAPVKKEPVEVVKKEEAKHAAAVVGGVKIMMKKPQSSGFLKGLVIKKPALGASGRACQI